ncbi:MAG: DUF3383 family protein [Clostridia bacterium]|nr:DUF3383 family protein [Clostridia bacterium]
MANDVKVVIQLTQAVGKVGFGVPLLVAVGDAKEYKEYANISEVKADYESGDVFDAAKLLFMQNNAPSKIAIVTSATTVVDALDTNWAKEWRQLIVVSYGTDETVDTVAEYVEAKKDKLFFAKVNDATAIPNAEGTPKAYERTYIMVYKSADVKNPEAAIVGATAGLDAGSFTYKNIIVKGLTAQVLTDAEIEAIHDAGGYSVVLKAGDLVTTEGKVMSGEYVDIVDSKDYVVKNIEYKVQKTFNKMPKLPYDNRGIAMIGAQVETVLKDAYNMGIIADKEDGTADYSVNTLGRDEVSASDRATRQYNGCTFAFGLAGAIHNSEIFGEIVV